LLFIGKLMVAASVTGISLLVFLKNTYYLNNLSSPVMPCVAIFILSFAIATLFMVIFECVIDTVFLCFLVDEHYNKGSGNMKAHPDLIALVDKHYEESKKSAAEQKATHDGDAAQTVPSS